MKCRYKNKCEYYDPCFTCDHDYEAFGYCSYYRKFEEDKFHKLENKFFRKWFKKI